MVETFACSFLATELDARNGIGTVVEHLRTMGLPESRAEDVQIALAEAINNVVEHAYAGAPPGDVDVHCEIDAGHLRINIVDAGHPLPGAKLPAGKPADLSVDIQDLPEGGFGWFLIRQLTSDVRYDRRDGKNRLLLCFDSVKNAV